MHQLILGDCLDVMAAMAADSVDVAYLDPPYNTGDVLSYRDTRTWPQWRELIGERLEALRRLLAPTGVVMVSVGDAALPHLRMVGEEVFGAPGYLTTFVWASTTVRNSNPWAGGGLDYVVCFARDPSALRLRGPWREHRPGVAQMLAAARDAWDRAGGDPTQAGRLLRVWLAEPDCPVSGRGLTDYDRFDPDGRVFRATPLSRPGQPQAWATYVLRHPVTGRPLTTPRAGWRYPEATMAERVAAGLVHFGPDERTSAYGRRYLDTSAVQVPRQVFTSDKAAGARALADLLGEVGAFTYPKDPAVLARLIDLVSGGRQDIRVLDPFAGSASTVQAVLDLNAADSGSRSVTAVTLDECDPVTGRRTFHDVALPRVRACITGRRPDGTATVRPATPATVRVLAGPQPVTLGPTSHGEG